MPQGMQSLVRRLMVHLRLMLLAHSIDSPETLLTAGLVQLSAEHERHRLLLLDAARLACSLAHRLVHSPMPILAVLGAVLCHLTSAHLHTAPHPFCLELATN